VYGIAGRRGHAPVAESEPLETHPDRRGAYSAAKQEAEGIVTEAGKAGGIPTVVLRPGLIYGSGRVSCPGVLGIALGRKLFVVFGNGSEVLPLVHVDNVVDATVLALASDSANGEIFNVLDAEVVTKRMYMEAILRPLNPRMPVIYLPGPVLMSLTWMQEKLMAFAGKKPFLTVYRLKSSQTSVRYSTARIETLLGWRPGRTFIEGSQQWVRETMQSAQADPASPVVRPGSGSRQP
jgi:nucleoside-diphosphate-sugar epimerase